MTLQELKKYEGQVIQYLYRGKYKEYILAYVQIEEFVKGYDTYLYEVGSIRLNYIDCTDKVWQGFWTKHIDRVRIK